MEKETAGAKRKVMSSIKKPCIPPSPPPPPPPRPSTPWATPRPRKAAAMVKSVTRDEIDMFWRRKRMEEEDHLLAAQKAAARIRAKALKEEDYKRFEESLREATMDCDEKGDGGKEASGGDNKEELRMGIKDWWTKSKYAYLNQPAIKSMAESAALKHATSTYIPQKNCFCYFSPAAHQVYPTSSFHVF
uniref:Protein PRRC2A n=1 Tax=Elaeis guineensis var. tenera TaxID=51953 RepID=A0A6I9SHM1_ELAGV|nr:protein PRRC2A [Elaeis guineensis]